MKRRTQPQEERPADEPAYLELAGEAVLAGMTRERVIAALISRVKRDEGYLAYRRACGRRTGYDEQVQADMQALALAAVLLEDEAQGACARRSDSRAGPSLAGRGEA